MDISLIELDELGPNGQKAVLELSRMLAKSWAAREVVLDKSDGSMQVKFASDAETAAAMAALERPI